MFKATPNPPESKADSPATLKAANPPRKPSAMFIVAPTSAPKAYWPKSMPSASVMLSDYAGLLEGPHRNTVLGIAQVVMLGELAVNRALDNIDPHE